MKRDQGGYIVVETIGSFTMFTFLVISILSLINIVTVQARVHYAITQAAETVSMYSYALEAMEIADHVMKSAGRSDEVEGKANTIAENINGVFEAIGTLNISGIQEPGKALYQQGSEIAKRVKDDPKDVLQNVMNYGLQKTGEEALGNLMRPLVGRYLTNGSMSGDEFLKAFHVVGGLSGLDFTSGSFLSWDSQNSRVRPSFDSSRLLSSDGDVRIVVSYKIDYTFGALPLPFRDKDGNHTLTVTQEVATKAWLGGAGEGYQPE